MAINDQLTTLFASAAQAKGANSPASSASSWWEVDSEALGWSQSYPYQLALWSVENGLMDRLTSALTDSFLTPFTLPIPPQTLNINTPFASTVSATMGGIVEENNGAPFRNITLQGTTGILPLRGTTARGPDSSSIQSIFGGTIDAVNRVITNASSIAGPTKPANLLTDSPDIASGSGYAQFIRLRSWLENYAEMKRTTPKSGVFLALCIWKERVAYICTPVSFDLQRSASSPLEYNYSISLKAWKRIKIQADLTTGAALARPNHRSPSWVARIGNAVEGVRKTLESAKDVVTAAKMDIEQAIFTPVRQTALLTKDAAGVAFAVADFPADLANDLLGHAMSSMALEDFTKFFEQAAANHTNKYGRVAESWANFQLQAQQAFQPVHDAVPATGIAAHQTGRGLSIYRNGWREDAEKLVKAGGLMGGLNIPADIPRPLQERVEQERAKAAALTRPDFEKFRDNTLKFLADYSTFVGVGDATFSATYSQPAGSQGRSEPTEEDWEIMGALSDLAQTFDAMAASYTINRDIALVDYVAGLASQSGIAFKIPTSKFLVPFPYDYSLEKLAERYLGSPDRWIEIAALNGLRSPYVDETGFIADLLVNGAGNTVWVADAANYYVGQSVWLTSDTEPREQRRIAGIQRLSATQTVLTMNGATDLDRFETANHATIQAFRPDTVNSMQFIYIPSDTEPSEQDFRIKPVAGVDYYDPYVRTGGVDLLLSPTNDLVITPSGTRLAVGMTNIIQRARIALSTPKGHLMRHPDFGLGIKPGTSTADISAPALAAAAQTMFGKDPMFSGVNYANVQKSGGNISITLGLNVTGNSQPIPITVDLRR